MYLAVHLFDSSCRRLLEETPRVFQFGVPFLCSDDSIEAFSSIVLCADCQTIVEFCGVLGAVINLWITNYKSQKLLRAEASVTCHLYRRSPQLLCSNSLAVINILMTMFRQQIRQK